MNTLSDNNPRPNWLPLLASVLLVTVAQLLLKTAASHGSVAALLQPAALLPLGVGLACYALSMLCWLKALETLPLGVAYGLLGLSYPLVYLGALWLPNLQESFSGTRCAGIALIAIGVALLVSRTAAKEITHA